MSGTGLGAGRAAGAPVFIAALFLAVPAALSSGRDVPRVAAIEVAAAANAADEAVLGRPLSLAFDAERLYVADAQDCAVKVFSKDGRFLGSFGRKGTGPGDLSFPSGVSVAGGKILVADKLNFRVQVFGPDGAHLGGFPVAFAPDRIFALGGGALLVTRNPSGRRAGEALLHIYDDAGRLLWEGLEARVSPDPVLDAFLNMIQVCPGEADDFFVVFRSGDRTIQRFDRRGVLLGKIRVDERHAFRPLDLPFRGPGKRLLGFCWAAARSGGRFFLSPPEPVDGRDLGPGREISVVGDDGGLQAVIELPRPVHRFVVEAGRILAVDDEGELRIFEVVR